MIKIGLIGCGFMGSMHANSYNIIDGVQVTAVADIRRDKAEELAKISGAEIYSTGMELIEKADVDAIDICLPTFLHTEHAIAAMKKVKNVFIEKPVAFSPEECDALLKAQEETGAGVQVGQVVRFWDEYVYLKDAIDTGKYGKVINAVFRRLSPRPTWTWENWDLEVTRSRGAFLDLHVHDTDFMLHAFGRPNNFNTVCAHGGEGNSYVMTIANYDDFVVTSEGTWDLPASFPFEMAFRVTFEKGVMEYTNQGFTFYTNEGAEPIKLNKRQISVSGGGNISDLGGYFNELEYFATCLKAGKKPDKATLTDACASVKFIFEEMVKAGNAVL